VRLTVIVMQQPVLLSLKFRTKSSHIFINSPQIVTVVHGIDCLPRHDELFVNSLLDIKENDEHTLDITLHLSPVFGFGKLGLSAYCPYFLPRTLV
jgi:hypothetical protein